MWALYRLAKTLRTRPSELVGLEDPYVAYCLDEAVMVFGDHVTTELEKVEGKKKERERKQRQKLGELLQLPDEQRFKPFRRPGG